MAAKSMLRSDAHVDIELDPKASVLLSRWKGYVPSENYREVLTYIQKVIADLKVRSWLSDSRKMGAILHEDTVWSMGELAPKFASTGLQRLAIVNSSDIIHQMAAGRMVEESAATVPYEMAFFDDPEAALEWVKGSKKAVG